MAKTFKKITAGVVAAATIATTSISAFADGRSESWDFMYILGAPSPSTKFVERSLYYYAGGYQSTCTDFNGGGDGYVSISVKGIERWKITGVGTVPRLGYKLEYSDAVDDMIVFRIEAMGDYVSSVGSIHQK